MNSSFRLWFLTSVSLLVLVNLSGAEEASAEEKDRSWTNEDGRAIVAKLKEAKGGVVTLLKQGKEYELAIESLSDENQKYIKEWASNKNKATLKISKKGKLLYETDFKTTKGWRVSSGNWDCENGAVIASQTGKGHKGHMVISNPKPVNVIIECEIMILEAGTVGFTIDDKPNKLGLINFSANGFGGQALHRKKKPAIKKRFSGVKVPLARDEWQSLIIEMIGNKITISSNGLTVSSIDDNWAGKPKRLGLRVAGGPSKYRALKMWEALPLDEDAE